MVIPKLEIIRFEKRKILHLFHSSISVFTNNGKIIFTSFIRRNHVYNLMVRLFKPS